MNELNLVGDLYMGFASFAYYVKTKYGYCLHRSGEEHLTLSGEGACFYFELTLICPHAECGYVYANLSDFEKIFGENFDLAKVLSKECWKRKGALLCGEKNWHCHVDESLKGNIYVKLDCETEVRCKYTK